MSVADVAFVIVIALIPIAGLVLRFLAGDDDPPDTAGVAYTVA